MTLKELIVLGLLGLGWVGWGWGWGWVGLGWGVDRLGTRLLPLSRNPPLQSCPRGLAAARAGPLAILPRIVLAAE